MFLFWFVLSCVVLSCAGMEEEMGIEYSALVLHDIPFEIVLVSRCPLKNVSVLCEVVMIGVDWEEVWRMEVEVEEAVRVVIGKVSLNRTRNEMYFNVSVVDMDGGKVVGGVEHSQVTYSIPGFLTVFPPLIAVVLVLVTRQAILGIFFGVWFAAMLHDVYNPLTAFLDTFSIYFVNTLTILNNTRLIVFILLLGGQTGLLRRGGGFLAISDAIMKMCHSSRGGQIMAWIFGIVINIQSYLSIFVVGPPMLNVFDALHISREKLAMIIDSTSGPVASLSPISNYMAVGVTYLEAEFKAVGMDNNPYLTFISTIPNNFYQINLLLLVLMSAIFQRDLPIMAPIEKKSRRGAFQVIESNSDSSIEVSLSSIEVIEDEKVNYKNDVLKPDPLKPKRIINGVLPLALFMGMALFGMFYDGYTRSTELDLEITLINILGNTRALVALIWGATCSLAVTIILYLSQRIIAPSEIIEVFVAGMKETIGTSFLLLLAWSLGEILKMIHMNTYVAYTIGSWLPGSLIPIITMFLGCVISFASGSSLGTQAILFPLVIPLVNQIAPGDDRLLVASIGALFSGSLWGDHCSPFSDITLLSALVAEVPPLNLVKAQFPYAIVAGSVAFLGFFIEGVFNIPIWLCLTIQLILILLILILLGSQTGIYNRKTNKLKGQKKYSPFQLLLNKLC